MIRPASHRFASIPRRLLPVLAALLLACSSDDGGGGDAGVGPNGVPLQGTIIIKVVDSNTRQPLAKVDVSLVGGPQGTTDTLGQVTLKQVKSGVYFLRVDKNGYELDEQILDAAVKGELTPVPLTMSKTVTLHLLGAKVKGRFLLRPDRVKAPLLEAAGVPVELRLTGTYANPIRTVTTTANGEFTFDNLPELTGYSIRVPEFSRDGKKYRYSTAVGTAQLYAGEEFEVPLVILEPNVGGILQVLTATTVKLEKGKAITVEFSGAVDTSVLTPTSVVLRAGFTNVAAKVAWSANRSVLNVSPFQSDWSMGTVYSLILSQLVDEEGGPLRGPAGEATVTLSASLSSVLGSSVKVPNLRLRAQVYVPSRAQNVDTGVVDYFTTTYRLMWGKVDGALGYDVYTRNGDDSAWKQGSSSIIDTQVVVSLLASADKPVFQQHMVLAKGEKPVSSFEGAATLSVRDSVKPTLYLSSANITILSGVSFNNTAGSGVRPLSLTVQVRSANLSQVQEPLDTAKVPEVRVAEGGAGTLSGGDSTYVPKVLRYVWTSRTTARIDMEVEATRDGRNDSLVVDYSKVTDMSGNPFETLGGSPVIRFLTY